MTDLRSIKIKEVMGMPVYASEDDYKSKKPMTEKPRVGDEVGVYMVTRYIYATVKCNPGWGLHAESENHIFPLEFDEDVGHWVSTCMLSREGLKELMKGLKDEQRNS